MHQIVGSQIFSKQLVNVDFEAIDLARTTIREILKRKTQMALSKARINLKIEQEINKILSKQHKEGILVTAEYRDRLKADLLMQEFGEFESSLSTNENLAVLGFNWEEILVKEKSYNSQKINYLEEQLLGRFSTQDLEHYISLVFDNLPESLKKSFNDPKKIIGVYVKVLSEVANQLGLQTQPKQTSISYDIEAIKRYQLKIQEEFKVVITDNERFLNLLQYSLRTIVNLIQQYKLEDLFIADKIIELIIRILVLSDSPNPKDSMINLVVRPTTEEIYSLQHWLLRNMLSKKQSLTIITTVCPDYDIERLDTSLYKDIGHYRYTGKGLHDRIGGVGEYINIGAGLILQVINSTTNLALDWIVGYAGFEANADNSKRNGINPDVFKERVQRSAIKMQQKMGYPVGVFPEYLGISLEDYNNIKDLLLKLGDYGYKREAINDALGEVTSGVDWLIMGLIASAKDALIMDGASVIMARNFYRLGIALGEEINQILKDNNISTEESITSELYISNARSTNIVKILNKNRDRGEIDEEKISNLIRLIISKVGKKFTLIPSIYIRSNYLGYE